MPPDKTYPIEDEQMLKCAGCTGQFDNHNTGSYCRYGFNPADCQGPEKDEE